MIRDRSRGSKTHCGTNRVGTVSEPCLGTMLGTWNGFQSFEAGSGPNCSGPLTPQQWQLLSYLLCWDIYLHMAIWIWGEILAVLRSKLPTLFTTGFHGSSSGWTKQFMLSDMGPILYP